MTDLLKVYMHFELGQAVPAEETRSIEFKEVKGANPVGSIVNTSDEYAVAFLNSEGGQVLWGVRDQDHVVVGVELTLQQRDELRKGVLNKLHAIQPAVDPLGFRLHIEPVIGSDSKFVIVLTVPKPPVSEPFFTGGHEAWVRADGIKKKLSGPQMTAWIKSRSAAPPSEGLSSDMRALVSRVRRLFMAHGVEATHLARFFKHMEAPFTIDLTDLETDGEFLRWINEAKLDWISNMFAIRREWLDGEDENIHRENHWDKHTGQFVGDVDELSALVTWDNLPDVPVAHYLQSGVGREWQKNDHLIYIVLQVPLMRISERRIAYKYLVDFAGFPWTYPRCNIQLRAWARYLEVNRQFSVFGREVPKRNIEKLISNRFFLHELLNKDGFLPHPFWHPSDHASYPQESVCAQSVDTLPHVIEFLRKHNLPWEPTCRLRSD